MQGVPAQVVLVHKHHEAVFLKLKVLHLNHLPGLKEHHGAGFVVVPGAAIQHHARFYFLETNHIKIAGELAVAYAAGMVAAVGTEERALWCGETVLAMQFG